MALRKIIFLCAFLSFAAALSAKDFWEEPFDKWSREQVMRMLSDSPWAQSETFTGTVDAKDAGLRGEKELYWRFTIRFFSALPVREAYVRMARLMNNYDQMSAEQRQELDKRFQRALSLDVTDRVIVSIDYDSNNPDAMREYRQMFEQLTADRLKQSVYLITRRLGRVELREYFPPSADGTGAKFVFPRTVNGQPVFMPEDKEIRFDFELPRPTSNFHISLPFKSAKMAYQGQLSY
jgi:hypothetical protein